MEGKKNKGLFIASIILAVLIVLVLGIVVFLAVQQGYGKVQQNQSAVATTEVEQQNEQYLEQPSEELELDGFSLDGEKAADASVSGEYLCDYSSTRELTTEDIASLKAGTYSDLPEGKSVIRMAVNEMYAKYGYTFSNQDIQQYFDKKQWYQDIKTRSNDMNAIYQGMNDIEKKNVDLLTASDEED